MKRYVILIGINTVWEGNAKNEDDAEEKAGLQVLECAPKQPKTSNKDYEQRGQEEG